VIGFTECGNIIFSLAPAHSALDIFNSGRLSTQKREQWVATNL